MNKIFGILFAAFLASLSSCRDMPEYQQYLDYLEAETNAVDTISSVNSYADFMQRVADNAFEFSLQDIKLNNSQRKEISIRSNNLQNRLISKFHQLQPHITIPMCQTDSVDEDKAE